MFVCGPMIITVHGAGETARERRGSVRRCVGWMQLASQTAGALDLSENMGVTLRQKALSVMVDSGEAAVEVDGG